jgi:hypothetical protein
MFAVVAAVVRPHLRQALAEVDPFAVIAPILFKSRQDRGDRLGRIPRHEVHRGCREGYATALQMLESRRIGEQCLVKLPTGRSRPRQVGPEVLNVSAR